MKKIFQQYKMQLITVVLYLFTLIKNKEVFINSLKMTGAYLLEMLQILPFVFVISGIIITLVPKELVMKNLGSKSGFKGALFSIIIGAFSAGPIYAAFPLAYSLLLKGAGVFNIIIIISSWAVIKIPMMLVEVKFLGSLFMISRLVLTVPGIILIGYIANNLIKKEEIIGQSENVLVNKENTPT